MSGDSDQGTADPTLAAILDLADRLGALRRPDPLDPQGVADLVQIRAEVFGGAGVERSLRERMRAVEGRAEQLGDQLAEIASQLRAVESSLRELSNAQAEARGGWRAAAKLISLSLSGLGILMAGASLLVKALAALP